MFLSDISIKRPVLATMMNAAIIVFGLFSLPKLNIEQYPNIDFPIVLVRVGYPGGDPQTIEEQVVDPLEKAVNGINGLEKIDSTSFSGGGFLALRFALEKKTSEVAQDVRDKVFAATGDLPSGVETPIIEKAEMGGQSVIDLSLSSKSLSIAELSLLVKDKILPRLQRIDGVARVDAPGQRLREIHVLLNRNSIASNGITVADVQNSIRAQAIDVPAGKIENEDTYFPVRVTAKLRSAEDVASLPVVTSKSHATGLQIRHIAQVTDTIEFEESASYFNDSSTILLKVFKQSGANTTAIADGVNKTVESLKLELPKEVNLEKIGDNSLYIRASIEGVELDLLIGALLAILTVFLFLRNTRATLISAVALPTAVIGTFAFLQFMGFTLNMMTTLGLSLSIGILIDDAIVVIENIYRHLSMGKTPKQAAIDATAEIGLAVLATTMTICAVFVPVAFMEGIIGRFFYQFGLTVAIAVLISLFVAFTLTPMLASRYLVREIEISKRHRFIQALERMFDAVEKGYERVLAKSLKYSKTTVAFGLATFVLSIVLLKFVDMSFFPTEDESRFTVSLILKENTPLAVTKTEALALSKKIRSYPGVKNVVTSVGTGGTANPNAANLKVNLVPKGDRSFSQTEFMDRMRSDLAKEFSEPKYEIGINEADGGGGQNRKLQFLFLSNDSAELEIFCEKVATFLREKLDGAVDVITTKAKDRNEITLSPKLAQSNDLGISPLTSALQTRTMFEGEKVARVEDETGRFDVRLRLDEKSRRSMQDIESVSLKSNRGGDIALMSAIDVSKSSAPSQIERHNGQRTISVMANYTKQDLSAAVEKVQQFVKENSPPSVTMSLEGEADIMQKSVAAMISALLLAVLLIYMILCVQYERYLAPFVIMMSLPLSFTGAFGALLLTNQSMSIYTMIGLILLMGLVTKNGILMIDFTLHQMAEGMSVHDALMKAGPIRLRPILMTTIAASFGMLPLAIGHGEGGEAKSSMGIAVIGGLVISTLLTLVVVPCMFLLLEKMRNLNGVDVRTIVRKLFRNRRKV